MGFETYPFPEGLTPNIPAADYSGDPRAVAIAEAARRLNELREAWPNPPDLVERIPEVVLGFPDHIPPVDDRSAALLKKRTLTNLYNERPAWLDSAHVDLDAAVAAAYGWPSAAAWRRCSAPKPCRTILGFVGSAPGSRRWSRRWRWPTRSLAPSGPSCSMTRTGDRQRHHCPDRTSLPSCSPPSISSAFKARICGVLPTAA
jgi:hypothetical protein